MDAYLKLYALGMALGQYLSSTHTSDQYDAVMEALSEDDKSAFENLDIFIWQPHEDVEKPELATMISDAADSFYADLKHVADKVAAVEPPPFGHLPFGIVVEAKDGAASVTSNLHLHLTMSGAVEDLPADAAADAIESLLMALASEGVNVNTKQFATALTTAVDAIGNNLGEQ